MAASFAQSTHCRDWMISAEDRDAAMVRDRRLLPEVDLLQFHSFFVDVANEIGKRLTTPLRQQVIATTLVYVKRFYCRNDLTSMNPFLVLATAMYVAIKTEECGPMSIKKFLLAIDDQSMGAYKQQFSPHWPTIDAALLAKTEYYLMQDLRCSLVVFHPYRPLALFCQDISEARETALDALPQQKRRLLELSWTLLNESYRIDLCMRASPHVIALGCLNLAASMLDVDISAWLAAIPFEMAEVIDVTQQLVALVYRLRMSGGAASTATFSLEAIMRILGTIRSAANERDGVIASVVQAHA